MIPAYFNWSGGKDSMLALHHVLSEGKYDVRFLVTTANSEHERVSMHGVRLELMEEQAKSLGIPLHIIRYGSSATMEEYENAMQQGIRPLLDAGIRTAIFGDIFLEDLKNYRVQKLKEAGVEAVFPLWERNTKELITEFLDLGYKTVLVCTDNGKLDNSFIGQTITPELITRLPENVDPCGENGEFHTFVYDGPLFHYPLQLQAGEVVERSYESENGNWSFLFIDLFLSWKT